MLNMIKNSLLISTLGLSSLYAANSVTLSNDGTGDFLIAPLYIASGDICSKIKVMNTNEYSSILAKVTIREKIASHEVDLPIFLSPGDVWEGNICQEKDRVILRSTDDSNHPSAKDILKNGIDLLAHSSATSYRESDYNRGHVELNGKMFKLDEDQKTNLNFSRGYVEVYPIAQFNEKSKKKVDKNILVERWDRLIDGEIKNPNLRLDGVDESSLSGLVSFNTSNQETATIPMTAFKNVHSKQITGEAINYTSDSDANILLGKESKIDILKLLQHKTLSFTYDNCGKNQYVYIAFPFSHKEKQSRRYKLVIRDMNENKYTMVFSPKFIMHDELVCISVAELIAITNNKKKFEKGMIQIKDIINNDQAQLGKNQNGSMLPIVARISHIGGRDIVINGSYLPVK